MVPGILTTRSTRTSYVGSKSTKTTVDMFKSATSPSSCSTFPYSAFMLLVVLYCIWPIKDFKMESPEQFCIASVSLFLIFSILRYTRCIGLSCFSLMVFPMLLFSVESRKVILPLLSSSSSCLFTSSLPRASRRSWSGLVRLI